MYSYTDQGRPDIVPEPGLDAAARAYARLVEDVSKVEKRELPYDASTSTAARQQ